MDEEKLAAYDLLKWQLLSIIMVTREELLKQYNKPVYEVCDGFVIDDGLIHVIGALDLMKYLLKEPKA